VSSVLGREQTKDYYDLLGVKPSASERDIKKSFRKLALLFHPDKNPDPKSEDTFKKVAEAYGVLSDKEKRAKYDSLGHEAYVGSGGEGYETTSNGFQFDMNDFFKHFDDAFHENHFRYQREHRHDHRNHDHENHERPHFNHHFQRQHSSQRKHYQENPESYHDTQHRGHSFQGFNFDDLFNDMDSDDFGSFFQSSSFQRSSMFADFQEFEDHSFGGRDSFFGSHFGHDTQEYHEPRSGGCKTVTKRSGNTIMTHTVCS